MMGSEPATGMVRATLKATFDAVMAPIMSRPRMPAALVTTPIRPDSETFEMKEVPSLKPRTWQPQRTIQEGML